MGTDMPLAGIGLVRLTDRDRPAADRDARGLDRLARVCPRQPLRAISVSAVAARKAAPATLVAPRLVGAVDTYRVPWSCQLW